MEVREKLLPEDGAISQLAMSAMDDWGEMISERDTPVLVIIEGLTMYLTESDVKRIFEVISARFDKVTVFVAVSYTHLSDMQVFRRACDVFFSSHSKKISE